MRLNHALLLPLIQEICFFQKAFPGPRNPGEFVRPTYEQKRYWKALETTF